jgi:hypothetical protein
MYEESDTNKLEHCIRKLNTHMRNVFLCLKIEVTHIFFIAYDYVYVVKLVALQHVKNIVLKFPRYALRGYVRSCKGLHYSEKSKAVTFTGNSLGM